MSGGRVQFAKIIPDRRRIEIVTRPKMSQRVAMKLCGVKSGDDMTIFQMGIIDNFPVRAMHPKYDVTELAHMPRWQLNDLAPVTGTAVVFGANINAQAASCPFTAKELMERITWLDPVGELGEVFKS